MESEYRPSKNVLIDDAMIPFKGRLSLKQYMPLKPVKRGIKVWECADSSNGFVCDLEVYTGKQHDGNPGQGLGHRVVCNLTWPLVGKNHHVFVDNFFNSLTLAEDLLWDQIYICGTVRGNRQGIPQQIAPSTQRVKRLCQGESLFLRKGTLSSLYGRTRSQFIFWAPNLILWGTTLSVDGNAMERWFKFPEPQSWKHTTTTWAVLT